MTSKLKKLKDLERKLTVSIPVEEYNSKFQSKLNNIKDFDKFLDNLKSKAKLENNFENLGIDIENDYSKSNRTAKRECSNPQRN